MEPYNLNDYYFKTQTALSMTASSIIHHQNCLKALFDFKYINFAKIWEKVEID